MELDHFIFMAKVMHKRFFPRENGFVYRVYYIALMLSRLDRFDKGCVFGIDRPALFSVYRKDHGAKDGSDLVQWAQALFRQYGVDTHDTEIILVAMPRIFGFVFNPVSFWMLQDQQGILRAVIAEVNNTFGETHRYLCIPPEGESVDKNRVFEGKKLFHVSPFLERSGHYTFRFANGLRHLGIWIDYIHAQGQCQLATSLVGTLKPLTAAALLKAFAAIPFVTIKTVALIHWQAIKLALKKIRYIDKPPQINEKNSVAR